MKACGIIVAAGAGRRMGGGMNKALMGLRGRPLFVYSLQALKPCCEQLILVIREDERPAFERVLADYGLDGVLLCAGGRERRHSVENALNLVDSSCGLVLVHDAARPLVSNRVIEAVLAAAESGGAAVPALPVHDTLRRSQGGVTSTLPRDHLFRVQTPQGFRRELLQRAYREVAQALTDDAGLVEAIGHPVTLVPGDERNLKITRREDLAMAESLLGAAFRMGTGFDTHRLVPGRELVLCGVTVPHPTGLLGHSDADVALHALADALLGACALGDIGQHFPDSDPAYKGISSLTLLERTFAIIRQNGFEPWQCDLTILAQKPRLAPYIPAMRERVARALSLPVSQVSVKATTNEGLDAVGREEGISAQALAVVRALD